MRWSAPCFLALAAFAVAADPPQPQSPPPGPVVLTDAALAIHREAIVFDGHNDLPWAFRKTAKLSFRDFDLNRPQPSLGNRLDGFCVNGRNVTAAYDTKSDFRHDSSQNERLSPRGPHGRPLREESKLSSHLCLKFLGLDSPELPD